MAGLEIIPAATPQKIAANNKRLSKRIIKLQSKQFLVDAWQAPSSNSVQYDL